MTYLVLASIITQLEKWRIGKYVLLVFIFPEFLSAQCIKIKIFHREFGFMSNGGFYGSALRDHGFWIGTLNFGE